MWHQTSLPLHVPITVPQGTILPKFWIATELKNCISLLLEIRKKLIKKNPNPQPDHDWPCRNSRKQVEHSQEPAKSTYSIDERNFEEVPTNRFSWNEKCWWSLLIKFEMDISKFQRMFSFSHYVKLLLFERYFMVLQIQHKVYKYNSFS